MFQSSNGGSANGDDATRGADGLVDSAGGVGGNGIRLGMDLVIFAALHANRLEGSQADMQCDLYGLDSALADAVENFRSEVKAGGRGCDRSALLGIDGLVALTIARGIRTRDVRRE